MEKPLLKAPNGAYYEIVRGREDSMQSGFRQGSETSMLLEQKVCPEAFLSGLPVSVVGSKVYAVSEDRGFEGPRTKGPSG
jgi:hypothetical protein